MPSILRACAHAGAPRYHAVHAKARAVPIHGEAFAAPGGDNANVRRVITHVTVNQASNRFYELRPDRQKPDGWRLGTPHTRLDMNPDPWAYSQSRRIEVVEELYVPFRQRGVAVDICMSTFGV